MDTGGSASDRLVGVPRASTIGRCVPELPRWAHRRDCCRQSPLPRTRPRQERTVETRDRTPNPRIKRERVSRSRCAELRKHAQHESLGAHRFHLYYTVTRHKTCHVSGGYISAAIRARRKNIIYATCSAPAMSGASTRELMRRMGHASMRAALIYQHASDERDRAIADFNDLPMFLIDSRTRPGQSGSPVIFFSSGPHISAHVRLQVHPCPVVSGGQKRRSHRSESKVPTVDRGWSPFGGRQGGLERAGWLAGEGGGDRRRRCSARRRHRRSARPGIGVA